MSLQTSNELLVDFAPPTSGPPDGPQGGLESRFEIHHDNQVELKLDYAIDENPRWTRYQTEAFIFVPRSLGISPGTYGEQQFFSDTQAYIRFQTPRMDFKQVLDETNAISPLTRLAKLAMQPSVTPELRHRELRMLGCLVKVNLRDIVTAARDRLAGMETKSGGQDIKVHEFSESFLQFLDDADRVCEQFRSLRTAFTGIQNTARSREFFERTDEFLSLSVEAYLTELLQLLRDSRLRQKRKLRDLTDDLWDRVAATIRREQEHRRQRGFTTHLDTEEGRATFTTRASSLKKFITSVLFLEITPRKEGTNFLQVIAAIAAAIAMLFSVSAAFVSERFWGLNSFPFITAIVLGYVFKDRIKDWVKAFFSAKVARWLPDRSMVIVDPGNGMHVGRCRETFTYLREKAIPESVRRWRHQDGPEVSVDSEYNPEVCLHYVKDVGLLGKRISNSHDRRRGINDIIRWNVSSFLSRMDDPERRIEYLDSETNELRSVVCPKRYQLNVVLALKAGGRLVSVQRYRVHLDRSGIHSLETLAVNGPDGADRA